jgi:hypothetical protein
MVPDLIQHTKHRRRRRVTVHVRYAPGEAKRRFDVGFSIGRSATIRWMPVQRDRAQSKCALTHLISHVQAEDTLLDPWAITISDDDGLGSCDPPRTPLVGARTTQAPPSLLPPHSRREKVLITV